MMSKFVISNRIFDPASECMPRSDLRKIQATHLRRTVEQAQMISFYRRKFAQKNIMPDLLRTVDDIRRLPFTTRQDLLNAYPFGFFAVPRSELARIHVSGPLSGKQAFIGYTKNDLKLWANLCARFLVAGGLTSDQLVQVAFNYGPLTNGFGLHGGIERVGAAVLPASAGTPAQQLILLRDAQINTLICTPTYALELAQTIEETRGIARKEFALKFIHLGGEAFTETTRDEIEKKLGVRAFTSFGLPELIGPGVAGECAARKGMHLQEDHFLAECLDPETQEPVTDGEAGELVVTTLTREACPVIRYRTGHRVRLFRDGCPCGRTTLRMELVS